MDREQWKEFQASIRARGALTTSAARAVLIEEYLLQNSNAQTSPSEDRAGLRTLHLPTPPTLSEVSIEHESTASENISSHSISQRQFMDQQRPPRRRSSMSLSQMSENSLQWMNENPAKKQDKESCERMAGFATFVSARVGHDIRHQGDHSPGKRIPSKPLSSFLEKPSCLRLTRRASVGNVLCFDDNRSSCIGEPAEKRKFPRRSSMGDCGVVNHQRKARANYALSPQKQRRKSLDFESLCTNQKESSFDGDWNPCFDSVLRVNRDNKAVPLVVVANISNDPCPSVEWELDIDKNLCTPDLCDFSPYDFKPVENGSDDHIKYFSDSQCNLLVDFPALGHPREDGITECLANI